MCLVISTDTKFDKSHLSIICLTVFFGWAFAVLISFCTILCNTFQEWPHIDWPKTLLVLSNFKRASDILFLEIPSYFCSLAHILGHTIFISLEIFAMILNVRIFSIFRFGLVWFGFVAYQPLLIYHTYKQFCFIHINSSVSNNSV